MRKAFDANVPKLKPRLGRAATGEVSSPPEPAQDALTLTLSTEAGEREDTAPAPATPTTTAIGTAIATPTTTTTAIAATATQNIVPPSPAATAGGEGWGEGGAAAGTDDRTSDVLARKARLEKIKRRVAEAARPQPRLPAVPADPARARESVLGLVRDLEAELVRAREREDALRGDLDEARRELARVAEEGRSAVERLASTEQELEEKRGVLAELLGEMEALEEERDASVRRAQALATLDEERAKLLEDLGRRADEEARLRAERETEVERLSEELRLAGTEGARLRAAVGDLARERDQLGADLDRARRERDELNEAKRALEAVHAALAQARARLG